MNRFTRIAASAAAAVLLTTTAAAAVPSNAQYDHVVYEALAGKTNVSKLTVGKIADQIYTGKAIKPTVTVKNGKTKLKAGTDYSLTYKNNKKVGTATITITGKGNYTGSRNVTFKIVKRSAELPDVKVEGKIKWLAWYNMDETTPAAELFKKNYGDPNSKSTIFENISVNYADRFNKLTTMIQAGDSPDLYPLDTTDFPYGVMEGRYQAVDDIIDLDSDLWSVSKDAMDQLAIGGKHYCAFNDISFSSILFYQKGVIKAAGLDDPRTLYDNGEWTWDTFLDMARKFQKSGPKKYVIDGYNSFDCFVASTGVPVIGLKDGKLVNNLKNANLKRAADLLLTLNKEKLRYPMEDNGWSVNLKGWLTGSTLFYGNGGTWEFDTIYSYGQKLGWDKDEIGIVPYPRDPQADKYYHLMTPNAVMWCKGSTNKNGVAAWLSCSAASVRDSQAGIKKDALKSGWTSKNWDLLASETTFAEDSRITPVIDMKNGIGNEFVEETVLPVTKNVYMFGESFTKLRKNNLSAINKRLREINSAI